VFGNPAIVALDEPNSNLDEDGEAALIHAIAQMKAAGTTVVIISHRPSILGATDQIMVLEGGRIRMYASRADVLAAVTRPVLSGAGRPADLADSGGVQSPHGPAARDGAAPARGHSQSFPTSYGASAQQAV
jgi:ABC-type protease/lipase transport system fused ATPase/permease subunit